MNDTSLTDAQITDALTHLPGWTRADDCLCKSYTFDDFKAALAFMVRIGFEAESRDHHPEWSNIYNRVDVRLSTHSASGKITAKDVDLAKAMERVTAS